MLKNTAGQFINAELISATDGSAFTGAVTVYVTGNNGSQAIGSVGSGACTHKGNGLHQYAPAQAETNYDLIAFTFIGTGAIPATVQIFTLTPTLLTTVAGYLDTEIAAIKAKTDNLPAAPAAAGDCLTAAGVRGAIGMASADLDTQLGTLGGYIDTEVAAILAAVDTEVAAIKAKTDNLPAAPAAVGDIPTAAVIADAVLDEDMTSHQTQGSLGQAIGDPVADTDTIWGLVNARLDATVSSRASQTSVDTLDDYVDTEMAAVLAAVDTEVAAIKAKTDNLPADPADASDIAAATTAIAGYIDTEVAAIKAKTDNLPADPADASDIAARFDTVDANIADVEGKVDDLESRLGIPVDLGTGATVAANLVDIEAQTDNLPAIEGKIDTIGGYLDTEIAAIKAKTDNLPADPADASDIAARFNTVDTNIDALPTAAELATALAAADDAVLAQVALVKAKTDNLPADPADASDIAAATTTIASYIDTEVAAIKAKTDNLPSDPADQSAVEAAITAATAATATKVDEMHKFRGLDGSNPWTVTEASESAGGITVYLTGDGETTSTATRS